MRNAYIHVQALNVILSDDLSNFSRSRSSLVIFQAIADQIKLAYIHSLSVQKDSRYTYTIYRNSIALLSYRCLILIIIEVIVTKYFY